MAVVDAFLDEDGLWATVPVGGREPVKRSVRSGGVVRARTVWPVPLDADLPPRLAGLLRAGTPGTGLVSAARLVAACAAAAEGPVAPAASATGWRWSATPTAADAPAWEELRATAPDVVDRVVAALAGPVGDIPDVVPDRLGGKRIAAWRAWAARVAARRAAGARLAVRLDAPDEHAEHWRLVPLAVGLADDTTRVAVVDADPATFGASGSAWNRWLLLEAAAATAAWPAGPLGTDLAPIGLDELDVVDLVREGAQALADAGVDVVAASGLLRTASVRRRARSTGVSGGLSTKDLRLELGVTVDGEELTADEVARLAAAKTELVLVRGRWTRVDDAERARLARLLLRLQSPVATADLLVDEAFTGVEVEPPERLAATRRVEPPDGLRATLRPYQRDGLDWLTWVEESGTGGVLADDMGLGKTLQVLARVLLDAESGGAGPTLVVCPLTLVDTWARQAEQFAPQLRVAVHHGADREDVTALAGRADLVLTTYGLLARDPALREVAWHRAVLDEAQAVKNPDTRTARAARALTATHRLAVTGTPVENHLGELWSVMAFAAPSILPRRKDFERTFVKAAVDEAALDRLRAVVGPFVLRRAKSDPGVAPDLPPRTVIREDCALTREQVGAYEAAAAAMLEEVEGGSGGARRLHVLAGIARLKQVLVHPALLSERRTGLAGRSGKVDRLGELLAQIVDEGQAAVVFTQFASFVPALAAHLSAVLGVEVLTLTGSDDRARRAAVVDRFSADGGPPVLVVSLKAGGTGLTLVRANHVVHLDRWWNPAVEDQASDRVWRIGQRQKVFVHTLVCPGTLEDRIDAMLAGKRAVASSVVRSTDTRVSDLTDAELADLVGLVRERVLA